MGQSSVILTLAAALVVGILIFAAQRSTGDADLELAAYHEKVLAREAANTGINMTVRRLVDDLDNWEATPTAYEYTDTPYYGATFSTTVSASGPDTVDVVSTGVDANGTHVIEARYVKAWRTQDVPPAFTYAIIAEKNMELHGDANIMGFDDGSNANVHANGVMQTFGELVNVDGYGTYGPDGDGIVNPEKAIDDVFDPNVDENGADPNLYQGEDIDIPPLDPNDYNTIPPANFITAGDTSFSGSTTIDLQAWGQSLGFGSDIGTVNNPFLFYVDGNLQITGDLTILGYAQFVVDGTIHIAGNVVSSTDPMPDASATEAEWDEWYAANLDAAGNTTIGYYATGIVDIGGESVVVGQVYSNSDIELHGGGDQGVNLIGAVTSSGGSINVNGGVNVHYSQVSETTILPGWTQDVPEGVRLIAWAEF